MKDINSIYFPQNLDFRGRVYPIPPHMNHMGSDISRGMLEFTEGVRLGKEGLKWLKIQFANVWGKDKAVIEDKLRFVEESGDLVRAIAEDPFRNRQWTQNEDAWQSLAACF
jgi:DNA-directed RNA polymerase